MTRPTIPDNGIGYILDCGCSHVHERGMKISIPVIERMRLCFEHYNIEKINTTWSIL